jgi:hypothetical protein
MGMGTSKGCGKLNEAGKNQDVPLVGKHCDEIFQ